MFYYDDDVSGGCARDQWPTDYRGRGETDVERDCER